MKRREERETDQWQILNTQARCEIEDCNPHRMDGYIHWFRKCTYIYIQFLWQPATVT